MLKTPPDRRVITFYSYKGGVGRTMAVANVAYRLANKHGLKVIAVDWDLEAPGLHRFFGISTKAASNSKGLLDYFTAWREAKKREDPGPPDVSDCLIAITDEKHKPRFGELSLLTAGRLDGTYDARLAAFHWQSFYAEDAGAAAVETLREQLISKVDVVLVDSRTGLTDAGGICTIQVPDGVVLMTAPNLQSLEGTEQIARAIAKASAEARAGRARARVWLAVSRVPALEASEAARKWFAKHKEWFVAGVEQGLWQNDDHADGMRSHEIPYQPRWGFDEVVLNETAKTDARDPLTLAYDQITETMMRWLRGEPPMMLDPLKKASAVELGTRDIEALQAEVTEAEQRGDMLGMARSLRAFAVALHRDKKHSEAIRKAEQASGILLSRGAETEYTNVLCLLGRILRESKRFVEAEEVLTKALTGALVHDRTGEGLALLELAETHFAQGASEKAVPLLNRVNRMALKLNKSGRTIALMYLVGNLFERLQQPQDAAQAFRQSARLAQALEDAPAERDALTSLLAVADAGEPLPDAAALRARLAELNTATPDPA